TAVEDAAGRELPDVVLVVRPPLRTFAAGLVQLEHAVGLCPAEVQRDAAAGDDRPRPVVNLPPLLILVESQVEEAAGEVPGLRDATDDRPLDLPHQAIRRADVGLRLVL